MKSENVIYLRKSRADMELETHGELETLARHEKALLELARQNKLSITKIYKEIVSGENIASRPEVQNLLADVETGRIHSVLVMEVERLARGNTIDQGIIAEAFKRSGTKIITPIKTYDPNNEYDEEYFEFGLFMARREYKTINRRIQRGRLASVNEGKYIGSQAPYGYEKVRIKGGKGYTLLPVQDAEIVKLIYDLYINKNMGAMLIADELNQMHVKPKRTTTWHPCTIKDILSNPVYAGKIRWSYKKETKTMIGGVQKKTRTRSKEFILIDGMHEAIIDTDTFEKAQSIRLKRGHAPVKGSEILKNPLTGLIFCGLCGTQMTRLAPNPRNKYDTLKCPNRNCKNVSAPMYLVENKLLISLQTWLKGYELNLKLEEEQNDTRYSAAVKESTLIQLKSQIDKVNTQIANTYDLLEQGIYSKEVFLARNQILSKKALELKKQYEDLKAVIKTSDKEKEVNNNFIPTVMKLLDGYDSLPNATEKNNMLKSILSKIEYTKTERNTRGSLNNDNFELVITPVVTAIP